ncbi:MAG: hypothetical protein PF551_01675 [Candidatus Marinimicrobia bacterium]|jgi:hypothetical protein|nr:hypothetical protein [Candidatus Neomarinimicrobiota bacterium]
MKKKLISISFYLYPEYGIIFDDDQGYIFDQYGIVILPDVEDIDFSENPEMSWFGTKIPWGIPTTDTYMGWAEAVPLVPDMDMPPQGPAYRAGWNKVSGDGYDLYEE